MINKVLCFIFIVVSILCLLYLIVYNVINPDMTHMRIFINKWYIIMLGFISFLLILFLLERIDKNK